AVAVPVISNFLLSDLPFERMVVTVQWEIAERLLARPSTKHYGALAVLGPSLAHVEIIPPLPPPGLFPSPPSSPRCLATFRSPTLNTRAARADPVTLRTGRPSRSTPSGKTPRGAVLGSPGKRGAQPEVAARLAELGIDGAVRAEALGLEQHLRLCAVFG